MLLARPHPAHGRDGETRGLRGGCRVTSRWARYANPPAELRRHALVCVGAGRQEGPLPSFRDRTLAQHALVLITRGSGRFVQSDPVLRRTEVVGPALIWVQPGARHGYGSPEGWEQFWLLLSGRGLLPFESVLGASRARPVIPLAAEPQGIRPLFDELREVMDAVSARDALAASVLAQRVLIAVADAVAEPGAAAGTGLAARVADLAADPIPMAARARVLGLTLRELQTRLREETGLSPAEFVIQVRLGRAQALLAESDLSVAAIARQVGYDDPAYFSRLFARRVGEPPTTFRASQPG